MLAHVTLVTVVSLCLVAGWWQVDRARSGNLLSYGYAVEWPVFAVIAVVMWWQLIHDSRKDLGPVDPDERDVLQRPLRRPDDESPALRDYNDGLAALAARGKAKTWRNPRGLP